MSALSVLNESPKPSGTVEVTEAAARAIQKYLVDNAAPVGSGLRLGVRGGGCSGMSYVLEIDTRRPTDHVIDKGQVQVFIDPKSMLFLQGTVFDYVTGLMDAGFKFNNPRAGKSCGCGESFSM